MAKRIFSSENYIIADKDDSSEFLYLPKGFAVFVKQANSYLITSNLNGSGGGVALTISDTDIVNWYDEAGTTAYTEATFLTFLKSETGFKSAGTSTALKTLTAGSNILIDDIDPENPIISATSTAASLTYTSVDVVDSPYSAPSWERIYGIHNDTGNVEVVLPPATINDVGKEIEFWVEHNPFNHPVLISANSGAMTINGQAAEGADWAKASIKSTHPSYLRVKARCVNVNKVYISEIDSVYSSLRYNVNFTSASSYSPYSYLQLSAIPTDFLTSNADWWFAVKVEKPMKNSSDGQVLFGSNNAFIAVRGNGTYFQTHSTSGYLQTISPNTIAEKGEWIIYQYDSATTYYTAWVNGIKVLNATSSGVTPPSTAPTNMWFGSEEGQAAAPSGYGYPINTCDISNISLGTGNLSDADAALFTSNTFATDELTLSGGTLTNQWQPAINDAITTATGAIDLVLVGDDISTSEL